MASPNWKPIEEAPELVGQIIRARGRDMGSPYNKRHYATVQWNGHNWMSLDGTMLYRYLTDFYIPN